MILWIIGAGGLLGSALHRIGTKAGHTIIVSHGVSWWDSDETVSFLKSEALRFRQMIDRVPDREPRWAIVWAAGKVTTASTALDAESEFTTFLRSIDAIRSVFEGTTNGVFALASSAGGIYGGSTNPPFSSESRPDPIGHYGELKLRQEVSLQELVAPQMGVVIARFANVYGPGQDLTKLQGLVSRLALSRITRSPITMFVPLDTIRDFITADDAAARLLRWIYGGSGDVQVRVIASGRPVNLAHIIQVATSVGRTKLPVASGFHPSAAHQPADLRLFPDLDEVISSMPITSLPVGIKAVFSDIAERHGGGRHPQDADVS